VVEVKDVLLQGGWDHHLVSAVGGRGAAEDPIRVLEQWDVGMCRPAFKAFKTSWQ